jgi:hypothetical protein
MGLPGYGSSNGGAVMVQYGGNWSGAYTPTTVDALLTGDGGLGTSVSVAGDLNSDGLSELLVGAPTSGAGKVYALDGSTLLGTQSLPNMGLLYSWVGEANSDAFGTNIGALSDLDRDGNADISVAAPGYDYTNSNAGKVYVLTAP